MMKKKKKNLRNQIKNSVRNKRKPDFQGWTKKNVGRRKWKNGRKRFAQPSFSSTCSRKYSWMNRTCSPCLDSRGFEAWPIQVFSPSLLLSIKKLIAPNFPIYRRTYFGSKRGLGWMENWRGERRTRADDIELRTPSPQFFRAYKLKIIFKNEIQMFSEERSCHFDFFFFLRPAEVKTVVKIHPISSTQDSIADLYLIKSGSLQFDRVFFPPKHANWIHNQSNRY